MQKSSHFFFFASFVHLDALDVVAQCSKMNFKCSRVSKGHTKKRLKKRWVLKERNRKTPNHFIDSRIDHRKWFVVKYALSNSYANDHFPDYLFSSCGSSERGKKTINEHRIVQIAHAHTDTPSVARCLHKNVEHNRTITQ